MTYTQHLIDDNTIERLGTAQLSPFEKAHSEVKPRLLEDLRVTRQMLANVEQQQPINKAIVWGQGYGYPGKPGLESQIYQATTEEVIVAGEVAGMAAGDDLDNFRKFQPEQNEAYLQAMLDAEKLDENPSVLEARKAVEEGYLNSYSAPKMQEISSTGFNDEQFTKAA